MHESVHALTAMLVGAKVEVFHFWAVAHRFTSPPADIFAEGMIAASAALVDIVVAALCIIAINRSYLPAALRLFLVYFAAFCLFSPDVYVNKTNFCYGCIYYCFKFYFV